MSDERPEEPRPETPPVDPAPAAIDPPTDAPLEREAAPAPPPKPKQAKRKRKPIRWHRVLAGVVAFVTALFIGFQLQETWRQSQLSYLQSRSQDFLEHEYGSASMGCLYDWWTPRQIAQDGTPLPYAAAGSLADLQCGQMRTDYAEYSRVLLYIEETLMYFVEEARVACENNVNYGRELEIWRADVAWDVTGAFSFYILNRFGDGGLGYAAPVGAQLSATDSVVRYLEQARLFGVTISGMCSRAEHFRASLAFEARMEPWAQEICRNPSDEPVGRGYQTNNFFDQRYCREVHYIEPTIGRRLAAATRWVDGLGRHIPF